MAGNRTIKTVGVVPRYGARGGEHAQTKITVDEYTGDDGRTARYIQVRIMQSTVHGHWVPTSKGFTIRGSDFREIEAALKKGFDSMREVYGG